MGQADMAKTPTQKPDTGDDDDPIPEEINDIIRRALKSPPKPLKKMVKGRRKDVKAAKKK